ncbi:MAG: hypothetical protein SFX19_00015 [Alphaproteobacteria bacterium]|nr:hypothetical protein [Alphaproteobacteria bacterium]
MAHIHWNYYLSIEADLIKLSRYIEVHPNNYKSYSIEIARLLMATCAEIDVLKKQIAAQENQKEIRDVVIAKYPKLAEFVVSMPRFNLSFVPWEAWKDSNQAPSWWDAYGKVKHHRHTDFPSASLGNLLNAVAGLFLLCLHFYQEDARNGGLTPHPELYSVLFNNFYSDTGPIRRKYMF